MRESFLYNFTVLKYPFKIIAVYTEMVKIQVDNSCTGYFGVPDYLYCCHRSIIDMS